MAARSRGAVSAVCRLSSTHPCTSLLLFFPSFLPSNSISFPESRPRRRRSLAHVEATEEAARSSSRAAAVASFQYVQIRNEGWLREEKERAREEEKVGSKGRKEVVEKEEVGTGGGAGGSGGREKYIYLGRVYTAMRHVQHRLQGGRRRRSFLTT
jgi:hypothetical protein